MEKNGSRRPKKCGWKQELKTAPAVIKPLHDGQKLIWVQKFMAARAGAGSR